MISSFAPDVQAQSAVSCIHTSSGGAWRVNIYNNCSENLKVEYWETLNGNPAGWVHTITTRCLRPGEYVTYSYQVKDDGEHFVRITGVKKC
jgi:hypothetical protein